VLDAIEIRGSKIINGLEFMAPPSSLIIHCLCQQVLSCIHGSEGSRKGTLLLINREWSYGLSYSQWAQLTIPSIAMEWFIKSAYSILWYIISWLTVFRSPKNIIRSSLFILCALPSARNDYCDLCSKLSKWLNLQAINKWHSLDIWFILWYSSSTPAICWLLLVSI
jgi:hypothetical protein